MIFDDKDAITADADPSSPFTERLRHMGERAGTTRRGSGAAYVTPGIMGNHQQGFSQKMRKTHVE